jgi:hypothetical protein
LSSKDIAMAALHNRNGNFRVLFRYADKKFNYTLGRISEADAEAAKARVEYLLRLVTQRVITVPPAFGIVEILKHDGKPVAE